VVSDLPGVPSSISQREWDEHWNLGGATEEFDGVVEIGNATALGHDLSLLKREPKMHSQRVVGRK
jgi:hypothetical protein